ncbi:MAG: P-II family nitrogen regulator [Aquificaceae bacterium]|nr:P-II family nitrogen regulator [Aquificaceae bacterium]
MKLVRAFIRPEKEQDVVLALEGAGFPALTKMSVMGRGKQKGLRVGDVVYEELPKTLLLMVVQDDDVEKVVEVIKERAFTGNIGDGKIFISPVEKAITIRTGEVEQ